MISGFGNLTEARLRLWLGILFAALAIPAAALILQAYRQSEFETFYRYQQEALAFAESIDARWTAAIDDLERRDASDFSFFIDGEPAGSKRSPLARLQPDAALPGIVGYFRLNPDGRFTSPVLPDTEAERQRAGLTAEEYSLRAIKFEEIRAALAGGAFTDSGVSVSRLMSPSNEPVYESASSRQRAGERAAPSDPAVEDLARRPEAEADDAAVVVSNDALNSPGQQSLVEQSLLEQSLGEQPFGEQSLGKLQDLDLDDSLQQESEQRQAAGMKYQAPASAAEEAPRVASADEDPSVAEEIAEITISAFETNAEPLRFGSLGADRAALVRNVWIEGQRHIVGALLDVNVLLDQGVAAPFESDRLATMSSLVIAIGDDIIRIVGGEESRRYPAAATTLDGNLLYQTRLNDPFDNLTLLFSVTDLPGGTASALLSWTSGTLALVLGAGFFGLYRVGSTQIRLSRQQQDFVAAVSHELKTPLTSIRMYGEMLQSGWVDDDKRKSYYAYIHDESERLSRLIDNVLQLARISRQETRYNLESVDATELADLIRSKLAQSAERSGFELNVDVSDQVKGRPVVVDQDCFLQIVINLVDNAIKFSQGRDPARVDCRLSMHSATMLSLSVRDYGPGIPRSQLQRIFELFYRPNSELTRETVGTGIGLAIVSSLAQGMGGSVEAGNRDPGAEFVVTLPFAPAEV